MTCTNVMILLLHIFKLFIAKYYKYGAKEANQSRVENV